MTFRKSLAIGAAALTLGLVAATAASAAIPTSNASKNWRSPDAQANAPQPSAANCDCPMMKGVPAMDEKAMRAGCDAMMSAPSPSSGQRTHPGGTGSR